MKVFCQKCKNETNHDVLADFKEGTTAEEKAQENYYWWQQTYEIIRCAGCEKVSFRMEVSTEDDYWGGEEGELYGSGPIVTLYPSRTDGREPIEYHSSHLPAKIDRVYTEVFEALGRPLPILAGMGLRALIEAICNDQQADGKDLQSKIDTMGSKGILRKSQCEMLHSLRFLGNEAAHKVEAAPTSELVIAFDIAEIMIKTLYILPNLSATITTGKKILPGSVPESMTPF